MALHPGRGDSVRCGGHLPATPSTDVSQSNVVEARERSFPNTEKILRPQEDIKRRPSDTRSMPPRTKG